MKVLQQPICLGRKDLSVALGGSFLGTTIKRTHFFHTAFLMIREGVGIKVECCGGLGVAKD